MAKVSHSNPALDDVWHPARRIVTSHVYPPIPDRSNDWSAHYDGDEEYGAYGWGPTKEAAIADLKDNYEEGAA